MDPNPDCFVSGALALVLRVSRLTGIAPLRFVKKGTGWCISSSRRWDIYGYFMTAFVGLAIMGAIISELHVDVDRSLYLQDNKRRVTYRVVVWLSVTLSAIMHCDGPRQMRCLIAYLNQLQKINSELNINLWPKKPSEGKRIILIVSWMVACMAITGLDLFIGVVSDKTWGTMLYVFNYQCYWNHQMRKMQFVVITLHVRDSFQAINENLRRLLTDNLIRSRSSHNIVRRLGMLYASVCDVVREVDQCHGLITFLMLCSNFQLLITSPYFFITNLFVKNSSQSMSRYAFNVILELIWCTFHVFNLVVLIEPCHMTLTEKQIEKTRELLSYLMRHANSSIEPLAVELELFLKYFMLNDVCYKPLKVITLSRALMVTIFGSILTYLVIMIQL